MPRRHLDGMWLRPAKRFKSKLVDCGRVPSAVRPDRRNPWATSITAMDSGHGALAVWRHRNFAILVRRGAIVVAAAGNQGALGGFAITRHPWVIPVTACDNRGMPISESNLGGSIGRRGLAAPGDAVTSLSAAGQVLTFGGTSVAAPFVTGAIALLWSEFRGASAPVRLANGYRDPPPMRGSMLHG